MAKNFVVEVWQDIVVVYVIVKTMLEATGLVATNLSKGRRVLTYRTDDAPTHRTSAAAQAYIDVELFQLVPNSFPSAPERLSEH